MTEEASKSAIYCLCESPSIGWVYLEVKLANALFSCKFELESDTSFIFLASVLKYIYTIDLYLFYLLHFYPAPRISMMSVCRQTDNIKTKDVQQEVLPLADRVQKGMTIVSKNHWE